jgi:tetratricopeptide (TPR) repeat protein
MACIASAAAPALAGGVAVREETLSLRWHASAPRRADPNAPASRTIQWVPPAAGSQHHAGLRTFNTVVLQNEYLRVQVIPELGGVVYRCVYLPAGEDLFFLEGKGKDWLPFWESGVKASFPFREHGIRTDQPASWRIVRGADGSATLALWMEFSRFDDARNRQSYGRFSDMTLSQHVTLLPGEALLRLTYRLANPSPWRQGWKVWNDALLPRNHLPSGVVQGATPPPPHTDTELIYPAAWLSTHNGDRLHRLDANDIRIASRGEANISLFAWDLAAGFAGLWYPSVRVNRLRLFDPGDAPGTKFYWRGEGTWRAGDNSSHMYNFVELWGGPHHVFEGIEDWIAPGQARQYTHCFAYVAGIGKADFANARAAVHFTPGKGARAEIVTLRPTQALQVTCDGAETAAGGPCAPDRPAIVPLGHKQKARLRIEADGAVLAEATLPLETPDNRANHEQIKRGLDLRAPAAAENHEKSGAPAAWGRALLNAKYPPNTLGAGRVALNLGRLDEAVTTLRAHLAGDANSGDGEAWHLLGAALLESGSPAEARAALGKAITARQAYPEAGYLLAILDLGDGRAAAAGEHLAGLIARRPGHWHARLLAAMVDAADPATSRHALQRAVSLAEEDPADPRAAWALRQAATAAGDARRAAEAKDALDKLLAEAGAQRRLDEFVAATKGRYVPAMRMQLSPPATTRPATRPGARTGAT